MKKNALLFRGYLSILTVASSFSFARAIHQPVLPLLVRSYGFSMTELGLISFTGSLGFAVFEPLVGWAYDRIGMKKIILFAAVSEILILPLFAVAQQLWQFTVISFFRSAASSGISATTRAAISHVVPESLREKAYGFHQTITTTGATVGPIVGGYVAQTLGYTIPFYVSSAVIVGSFVAAVMLPNDEAWQHRAESSPPPHGTGQSPFKALLTTGFLIFLTARVLSVLVGFFTTSLLAVYSKESLGATETEVGMISGLRSGVSAVTGVCFGFIATRVGRERLTILAMILSSGTYLAFLTVQSMPQLYAVEVIQGVGGGFTSLGLIVSLMNRVPRSHYGTAMGLYGLAEDIGGMTGALVLGDLFDRAGMPLVLYFLSSTMVVDAVVTFLSFKKFIQPQPP